MSINFKILLIILAFFTLMRVFNGMGEIQKNIHEYKMEELRLKYSKQNNEVT